MKKSLFLFAAICCMALTYAQAPIAMLQHGTNLTPFYGNDALINAYNAAQDEDIITLSPGVFNACDIPQSHHSARRWHDDRHRHWGHPHAHQWRFRN